jgi:hypothetical protein
MAMAERTGPTIKEGSLAEDLVSALHRILRASPQPLTLAKIHALLPDVHRSVAPAELADSLLRQVAASVLYRYPKYRSAHDRFWDRPMAVHIADLLQAALRDAPLPWSALRRRLPRYAQAQAEAVLKEQLTRRLLFRHPRLGRSAERFGLQPVDAKEYLRGQVLRTFERLERVGFSREQLQAGVLDLLHEEEWGEPRS